MQIALPVLLVLQFIVVALHDLVDVPGWVHGHQVRETVGRSKFYVGTAITAAFPAIAAGFAIYFWGRPKPWFVYSYWLWYCAITVISAIAMWWIPYFFGASQATRRMYTRMYRDTRHVLPPRGDNPRPNVFHLGLHVLFTSTLILALIARFGRP